MELYREKRTFDPSSSDGFLSTFRRILGRPNEKQCCCQMMWKSVLMWEIEALPGSQGLAAWEAVNTVLPIPCWEGPSLAALEFHQHLDVLAV